MDLADFREYCLRKPGATEGTPFGETVLVFKVGGKMFALVSLDEVPARMNLKCDPDLALELRDRFEQVHPGYHMNKKHWNTVELESGIPDAELRKMIDHSFDLIVKTFPKTVEAAVLSGKPNKLPPGTAAATTKPVARPRRSPTARRRGRR